MKDNVDLSVRAEAYVRFALWCTDHKMPFRPTAECIDLCIQISRHPRWDRHVRLTKQVEERLRAAGAEDITFEGGWPKFTSPIGEQTQLPFQKFT